MPLKKRYNPGESVTVFGQLVESDTGNPIAGAPISFQEYDPTTSLFKDVASTSTGGDGSYSLTFTLPDVEGTYRYRLYFSGTREFAADASPAISFKVALPKAAKTTLSVNIA
jgi:uncharacterized protein YfaS (alpha-2-macroglobulin family)